MLEARFIWFLRMGQLAAAFLFSFIVLGLSGNIINRSDGNSPDFAGLALASSILTMFAIIPVVIVDFFRKGAFTSLVVTEIVWTGFVTILWLAAAADTTSDLHGTTCSSTISEGGFTFQVNPEAVTICREIQAIAAFSWLNFFNLGAWLVFLIVAASISHTRGNDRVWLGPVPGTEFFAPAGKAEQSQDAVEYAPQQQQVPQGYMVQQGYPAADPHMQQQFTGNTYLGSPEQTPASYPPNSGYNAEAPPV